MRKIRLTSPKDLTLLSPKKARLKWTPVRLGPRDEKLRYTVTLSATRRAPRSGAGRPRRTKPKALFTTKPLKSNFYDVPIRAKGLKTGRTYWWHVQAHDQKGQLAAISEKRRFKVKKLPEDLPGPVTDYQGPESPPYVSNQTGEAIGTAWLSNPANFMPPPPLIWSKPVKLRLRSESGGSDEPETTPGGGSLEPQPLVWANTAGDVYLPRYLAEHANLYWDLSHIDGCELVQLQISGSDGFSEPNDGDVMDDAGVIYHYWGPPAIGCGDHELRTPSLGPTDPGIPASDIDLFIISDLGGIVAPSEIIPDVKRHIRLVPCNGRAEPVDLATDPVVLHCVRNPKIEIGAQMAQWTWGSAPGRIIDFSLMLEEPFPNVPQFTIDDTGALVPTPITAPSTLLIHTPPAPSMLDQSSMSNLGLSMDGAPVERRNQIRILYEEVYGHDTYVIPLPEWPAVSGLNFRLEQEWQGGIEPNSFWDLLDPIVIATLVPGIDPDWNYCGGVEAGFDSLYGREDLADQPTRSPFFGYIGNQGGCLPGSLSATWVHGSNGFAEFNRFMESTFRGARTVEHFAEGSGSREFFLDEPMGSQEVEVRFRTDNTSEKRFVMPNTTMPVMMRETRDSGEVLWKVRYLDGKYAGFYREPGSTHFYGSRSPGMPAGISRFDPPRMQIWVSVLIGTAGTDRLWADIHYDLSAV